MEVANEIHERCDREKGDCVTVEVAYVSERRGDEGNLPEYDSEHEITEVTFERAQDHFDYKNTLDKTEVEKFLAGLKS